MARKTSTFRALVLAAALTLSTSCASGTEPSDGARPLTLGSLMPLTGSVAEMGKEGDAAVKIAVDEANAAGGVNGQKIALETADTGAKPELAQTAMRQFLNEPVDAVVGELLSVVCLSIVTDAVQNELPIVSPSCTTPQLETYPEDGFFFVAAPPSQTQGEAMARIMTEDGHDSAVLIAQNDAYAAPLADAFATSFEELGGEITHRVDFAPTTTDFSAEMQQVASGNPEAIFMVAHESPAIAIVNAAAKVGLLESSNWYVTNSNQQATFPEAASPDDPTLLYGWKGIGNAVPQDEAAEAFSRTFKEETGQDTTHIGRQAYDATWLLILAAAQSDSMSGPEIRDGVTVVSRAPGEPCIGADCLQLVNEGKDIDYAGASGAVDLNDTGYPDQIEFLTFTYDADGVKNLDTFEMAN